MGTSQQHMSPTIAAATTRNDSVSVTLSYLNNGSIFELDQVRFKQNLTYQQSLDIVSHVSVKILRILTYNNSNVN